MRAQEFISEGLNHPCIVVDVQPAYEGDNTKDIMKKTIEFVNRQTGPVLMFVNAEKDGLTDDTIQDIARYWEDTVRGKPNNWDDEEPVEHLIDWNRFTIVDKGYGYLRGWMDSNVDPAIIIKTIRYMYQQKVNDTRLLFGTEDGDTYAKKFAEFIGPEFQDWMLSDGIHVNWISIAQLKKFSGAYIMGGGAAECLREVELMMSAFNIKFKRIRSLVY